MKLLSPYRLYHGDCVEVMAGLPADSVEAVVTDPPAGISFMGKAWDSNKGGRSQWVAWLSSVFVEVLRVLKPGGHVLVWALPRTSHWTATALEDAGFEIRDVATHHFGSGFPKSLNVGKAIDREAGATREVVGTVRGKGGQNLNIIARPSGSDALDAKGCGAYGQGAKQVGIDIPLTVPSTDAAKQWDGWGTALKPASEHWILARKPLIGTVAQNVQQHGTGALNIDGCRIQANANDRFGGGGLNSPQHGFMANTSNTYKKGMGFRDDTHKGRWPANLILSHSPDCQQVGTRTVKTGTAVGGEGNAASIFGSKLQKHSAGDQTYGVDGVETVEHWECVPDCPVAELDRQSGDRSSPWVGNKAGNSVGAKGGVMFGGSSQTVTSKPEYLDRGGASRFFYIAKTSKKERNAGCGDLLKGNCHPTVKPLSLMRYLCRLITSPNGLVLDPFMGSGSTGCAALQEGFRFIGIEKEEDSFAIATKRIAHGMPKK